MLSGCRTPGSKVPKTTLRDTLFDVACASLVNKVGLRLFPNSSMVEHRTVNPCVPGSSPGWGAINKLGTDNFCFHMHTGQT